MAVPASRIDLVPPLGAGAGLPLTFVWADNFDDTAGSGNADLALFDTALWMPRNQPIEGKVEPASPILHPCNGNTMFPLQTVPTGQFCQFAGAVADNTPPRLNYATGSLEHAQATMCLSPAFSDITQTVSFTPLVQATVTETGRHLQHPRRYYASARPANHTWQGLRAEGDDDALALSRMMPSIDIQIGSCRNENPSIGNNLRYGTAITHMANSDLPSNGYGRTYGDNHNSAFISSLWSCSMNPLETGGVGNNLTYTESQEYSSHWGLNLQVEQTQLELGKPLSGPDGLSNSVATHDHSSLYIPPETVQTIIVNDRFTDKDNSATVETTHSLGRVDLGNHVVADTCGLIGYEGVISATAFLSVSKDSNPPHAQAPPASPLVPQRQWNEDGAGMFAGINIQVHSGNALRRNGIVMGSGILEPSFKYGSDGAFVEPMTEGMSTTGVRTAFKGNSFNENANMTRFHTGRVETVTGGVVGVNDLSKSNFNISPNSILNNTLNKATSKGADRFILGDTTAEGGVWNATIELSQHFMKDRIPTKVKVVPVLVDTVDTTVNAGASHPQSNSITFKKPTVDYHVIISLTEKTRINATVDLNSTAKGTRTNRNFPQTKRLTANMDLEDEGCEIYHAIFRIDPTLERIFYVNDTNAQMSGLRAGDTNCPDSVIPRHNSENGGWNLHQLTPFRPIANASWAKVPLLCAAIEAGGFYQRGGISHLWDADAYGGELFVSADAIDANHFNDETWGNGQVWADGVGDLAYPRGSELLVFKYNPSTDPYYTNTATSVMNSPLWKISQTYVTTEKPFPSDVVSVTDTLLKGFNQYDGWSIHDWVFPQIELMRYLGREDKANARHPRHSLNVGATPIFHPTLHCSSLRFMDSGKMAMAAIHRDYIGSEEEYPASDINYPPNPDSGSGGGCPTGYYRSGDECIPITSGDNPNTGEQHLDPITGEILPTPPPKPTNGSGANHSGGGDNFDLTPSWARIQANTSARSLILLFSDIPADKGKAVGGRKMFDAKKIRVDGEDYYTQNWTFKDSWWSGSRISYWYSESAQRAIPITYGSYPEVRCSYAVLPKSLPHLFMTGIQHGYPTLQPLERIFGFSDAPPQTNIDTWANKRADHLKMTNFVPTTIGFSDYGASGNPHQEHGWSGWSFPRALYDPIGFGDNTVFFSDAPEVARLGLNMGTQIAPTNQAQWQKFGKTDGVMNGTQSFWSHHGPLHYGITTTNHPFKPTRTWKQVHGGVGYDIPIHLLAPAEVAVRARAGGRNSLNLEMETPFHRTDTLHLDGGIKFNTGYELGGKANPAATRTPLGQYYLRTNLWDDASRIAGNATQGLGVIGSDIRGPLLSGDANKLTAFWNDHPTEHFHAGAIPIMPNNDYDLAVIENERYAPAILGRIEEINDIDYVAVAEQLQSSVDVHVSSVTRPMWDSGSIVSGRGTGARDYTMSGLVSQNRSEMSGEVILTAALAKISHDDGFGKGQRILRTDDGTLHIFPIERSGLTGMGEVPVFTHYTKPLHNDLFWNRKAQRINPSVSTYDGKDEVGPHIGLTQKLRSACFAADSQGTIHAVVEIEQPTTKHELFYTYAKRKLVSYNPSPVYEWDWSAHFAVSIGNQYDLREPSLACDSNDRLHLACRLISEQSHIVYTTKLTSDSSFVPLPNSLTGDPVDWTTNSWSKVNATVSNPVVPSDNDNDLKNHKVRDCDKPKVCLIGDNTPMVFYRGGAAADSGTLGNRANDAIYTNVGRNETGTHDPSGRFIFDVSKAIHVVGVQNADQYPTTNVIYYDAIIDENDRAYVCIIKDDAGRRVLLNSFDASVPFADEYTSGSGLGVTKALFIPKNATVRPDYQHITMTTNGTGEIHMILGFTLAGADSDRVVGGLYRDGVTDATIQPLQWATTPASEAEVKPPKGKSVDGGYVLTADGDWPDGGAFLQPTTGKVTHFMEVWMPTFEFSQDAAQADEVLRSINIRWLSVPSMNYDSTNGWQPVGSAQSMNGHEDFTHTNPQMRSQRFWGFDASELDLKWATNELSWMNTMHGGARLYYPYLGGSFTTVGEGDTEGKGIAGWPI